MDIHKAQQFVRSHHRAVLSFARRDGTPAMSPVSVGVDEKGRFVISTRETAMKTKGIRRNGRASLCVVSDKWYGEWIQLEGVAEVLSLPEAMEPLVEYYRAVAGEHDDWDEYRTAMEQQRRVLIRITADRVGPTLSG